MTNEQASSCTSARVHLSNRQEGDIYFKNMTEGEEQYHTRSGTGQSSGKPVADTQHLRAWCPQMHKHKEHPCPPGEGTGTQLTSLGCCQWRVWVAEKGRISPLRHFIPSFFRLLHAYNQAHSPHRKTSVSSAWLSHLWTHCGCGCSHKLGLSTFHRCWEGLVGS